MRAIMTVRITGLSAKTGKRWAKVDVRPADEHSEKRGVSGAWLINVPEGLERDKSYEAYVSDADNNVWTSKDGKKSGGGDVTVEFIRFVPEEPKKK